MPMVLMVTDADWIENDIRAALTDPGTELYLATDPRQVVDAAISQGPAAAVVDLQVGSMGGMAVVRELRDAVASGEIGPLRTVLLLDRSADVFLARRAGADAWVLKPFSADELRRATALTTGVT